MGQLIYMALSVFEMLIFIRIIMSWVNPYGRMSDNDFIRFIYQLTDPILNHVRFILPIGNSGIDFGPMVILIIIDVIKRAL